jgi:hypothetical protein
MSSCTHQKNKRTSSSNPIEIVKKNTFLNKSRNDKQVFYDLTENVFDPTKFSPPNSFIANLKKRMNFYEDSTLIFSLDNN